MYFVAPFLKADDMGGIMFKYLIAPVAAVAVAAPVAAKDFPGARVEAHAGFDSTRGKISYEDSGDPANDFSADESTSGVTYGGTIGYDFRIAPRWYLGVEGSVDFADNKRCTEIFGDDAACFSVKRNLAAGARIGTPLAKTTLFYVGAAYVNGKARVSYTDDLDPANNVAASDTRDGYRLSAGIEQRIAGNAFAKVEYRYSDYKDYSVSDGVETVSLGFDRHQAIAALGVRF